MPETKSMISFSQVIVNPRIFEPGKNIFESKLTNFFQANGIKIEVQKKAILQFSVSEEIHNILLSLVVPNSPDTQT